MSSKLTTNIPQANHHSSTGFRWILRRTRRRLPTVCLGGKKPRRGFFLARLCRRVKLKLLRVKYLRMVGKLKEFYASFLKDVVEGTGTIESFQQRVLLETSFGIPVMVL